MKSGKDYPQELKHSRPKTRGKVYFWESKTDCGSALQ